MMRQPSVQFSTIASLLLHTVVFGTFMYTVKHQPRYVLPKTYTVNLVSPVKAAIVQPSLGVPRSEPKPVEQKQVEQRPVEKEQHPMREEPAKAAKYEMKESPKTDTAPVPKIEKEPPRPMETHKSVPVKSAPAKPIEEKGPTIVKEAKKTPETVAVKPEITKKTPPKEQPMKEQPTTAQPTKAQSSKEPSKDGAKDSSVVEDRISMLKSKQKLEQHAMLRSVVDLSRKDVKMGQSPTGASQSTSPSFGDAVNNEYSDAVGAHVRKRWAYPDSGKKSLEAIVVFTIRQDGRIEGMKLEKSSGNSFFDRSALSAVNKSVPMPQPPLDTYEVGIRFTQ
ncbi:MAG: cell envelope integrity protein TolA [Nitrospirae bacterium]|nr:cell envelope integrity protein TolA [Nitrospirota bacterium]